MVKVSQDSPPYLPGNFFSGEQQGEGHGVVKCVERENYQWYFCIVYVLLLTQYKHEKVINL